MSIIVTGATGFVGQNLIPYLQNKGKEIRALSLRNPDWERVVAQSSYTAIVHLAGKAHDVKNTAQASDYFKINTELTRQLFDLFLKSEARDFIYFSSVKAASDSVSGILAEDAVPDPKTPYGQSKQKAEEYILAQKLPSGKRAIILRPCMIHGPGNKGNLNLLYQFVAKGIPYPLAAFENKRSFLSVENLCFTVNELLNNSAIPSGIYNLADDESLSTNELVSLIAGTLGKKPGLMAIPQGLLRSVAKVGDVLRLPLNSERLKKLTENYVVSNARIKSALGISAMPVGTKEGLVHTVKSFA